MKELFKALDKSLENNDTKWYELYKSMDLSVLEKCKVVTYIKYYFYVPNLSSTDNRSRINLSQVMDFILAADKEMIRRDIPSHNSYQQELFHWMNSKNSEFSIRNKRLNYEYLKV